MSSPIEVSLSALRVDEDVEQSSSKRERKEETGLDNAFLDTDEVSQCVYHAIAHKAQNEYLCEAAMLEVMICRAEVRLLYPVAKRGDETARARLREVNAHLDQALYNHTNCVKAHELIRGIEESVKDGFLGQLWRTSNEVKAAKEEKIAESTGEDEHMYIKSLFVYDATLPELSLRRGLDAMKAFFKQSSERQVDLERALVAQQRAALRYHAASQHCLAAAYWTRMCRVMLVEQLTRTRDARAAFDSMLLAAHQHELSLRRM